VRARPGQELHKLHDSGFGLVTTVVLILILASRISRLASTLPRAHIGSRQPYGGVGQDGLCPVRLSVADHVARLWQVYKFSRVTNRTQAG
jgi:hypothetical protein